MPNLLWVASGRHHQGGFSAFFPPLGFIQVIIMTKHLPSHLTTQTLEKTGESMLLNNVTCEFFWRVEEDSNSVTPSVNIF